MVSIILTLEILYQISTLEKSGLIGLSVKLSECYRQIIEFISIIRTLTFNITTKAFKRFVDDSHVRFKTREQSLKFLDILNSQDPSIQYTTEFENENKHLSFLDVTITNTGNNSCDFKIFRKTSICYWYYMQRKTNPNIVPHIAMGLS